MNRTTLNVEDLILNYDPERPQLRFAERVDAFGLDSASARLPIAVPWPAALAPVARPLDVAPSESADLTAFRGYDAVVVTWTAAEAASLAAMYTPAHLPSTWYEYRHNVSAYEPLVTGRRAPFNDDTSDMARYYRSLGLYFPCTIGSARVLLFKSGLHLDYDGPATPVRRLIGEIVEAVRPRVLITTGTGGGIGSDVRLGDVVIASSTTFDCTTQFKTAPFATAPPSRTSAVRQSALELISASLLEVNAAKIPTARRVPQMWTGAGATIVTTDFFGFDDSTDYYHLQGRGRVCDMGDAMIGLVMAEHASVDWYAVRNVSDPQIANAGHHIEEAEQQAGELYLKYGAFTTAESAIATWAIIAALPARA